MASSHYQKTVEASKACYTSVLGPCLRFIILSLLVLEVMALDTSNKADYRHFYKLLLVGDSGVGKSCLLTRFADSTFSESRTSTIGVDFKIRTIEIDGRRIKLQVWDSAGQERFRTVSDAYYRGAHGIGVVFDVTNEKSFKNLESWWLKEMENNKCADVPSVLIGTKCDLANARKVKRNEVESFSRKHGMQYIETSSKTAERVSDAFMAIAREVYEASGQGEVSPLIVSDSIQVQAGCQGWKLYQCC